MSKIVRYGLVGKKNGKLAWYTGPRSPSHIATWSVGVGSWAFLYNSLSMARRNLKQISEMDKLGVKNLQVVKITETMVRSEKLEFLPA